MGRVEHQHGLKSNTYRRQPDAGLSRMEILTGAAECFKENGFAATSIDQVAARICSTKGRIYHHYASKADLFFDVYRAGMEMNLAAIEPWLAPTATPAMERLGGMVRAHALSMIRTQAFQRVVWEGVEMFRRNALPAPELERLAELADLRHHYAEHFRAVMDLAKAEGDLDYRRSSIALNTLFMVINGPVFWFQPRNGQTDSEITDIADECALYAMHALGMRPGTEAGKDADEH